MASLEQVQLGAAERMSLVPLKQASRSHVLGLRVVSIRVWHRCLSFAQMSHLVQMVVLSCPHAAFVNDHIGSQSANVRVIRQLRNLRSIQLGIIDVVEEGRKLLLIIRIQMVPLLYRLRMPMHSVAALGHHILQATHLRHIQISNIVKLLLRN